MAEFKFLCPQCRQKIQCDASYVGTRINCPACQQSIVVAPVPPAVAPPGERVIQFKIKVSTLRKAAIIGLCGLLAAGIALTVFELTKVTVLKGSDRLATPKSYQPPVAIRVVAKTDSTNLRLAYAADQIIFNWEGNPSQLRVDGGPADGLHQNGAGRIPRGKYVTILWVVTRTHQAIYVDGRLRFQHDGDYSHLNRPVTVFPANGSTVTVKSLSVKRVADSSR